MTGPEWQLFHGPYEEIDLTSFSTPATHTLKPGVVSFDIETGDGKKLFSAGDGYIRITALHRGDRITVTEDSEEAADVVNDAAMVIGHNILSFDLVAFAKEKGVNIAAMAEEGRIHDTMLSEILIHPPVQGPGGIGQVKKEHSLQALGTAKFGEGKSASLSELAAEYGGYDQIPPNESRYVRYCAQDTDLASRIARTQPRTPYLVREHRAMAVAAQIRLSGFRVDLPLLAERIEVGRATRKRLQARLADDYGLPLTDAKGRPYKAPQATARGKEAIAAAFADLGVELPVTPKSGMPAIGKEVLEELRQDCADDEDVVRLIDTVGELNGVRTVYETIEKFRIDDRVHPDITPYQASGRWSFTEPGLTVMGKRGGKYVEREVFLPEDGHGIFTADLSQVDARVVAAHCQDPAYMALFGPGMDVHGANAMAIWGDPARREDAKPLGHGWNYGMGLERLTKVCGSLETAREFDRAMKRLYPDLVEWKADVAERADDGELLDNGWGRMLRTQPGRGWTQAPALIGQSAAMDVLKEGMLRLPLWCRKYLRAVIHDEMVFSAPLDRIEKIQQIVIEAMTFDWAPFPDYEPMHFEADVSRVGTSWGDCYRKAA
jgi:DNA polymerase-1